MEYFHVQRYTQLKAPDCAYRDTSRTAFGNIRDGEGLKNFLKIALVFFGVLRGAQQAEFINYPGKKTETFVVE